jgi:dihydroorotase-like cyclic amidohydrolase
VNVVKAANENESLVAAFDRARSQVDSKAECLVALSVQIQKWSATVKTQVEEICQKKGVNSFILDLQSDAELFEAMEQLKKLGALARILPENRNIITLLEKQFASLQPNEAYLKSRPAQVSVFYNCPVKQKKVVSAWLLFAKSSQNIFARQ